jgi:hypothetical protein
VLDDVEMTEAHEFISKLEYQEETTIPRLLTLEAGRKRDIKAFDKF